MSSIPTFGKSHFNFHVFNFSCARPWEHSSPDKFKNLKKQYYRAFYIKYVYFLHSQLLFNKSLYSLIFFRLLKQSTEAAYEEFNKGALIGQPFMESLFSNKSLSWDDVIMLVMEIFLGGIDAVSKICVCYGKNSHLL